MRCEKCGRDFPSRYYFKTETICRECFDRMTSAEQAEARKPPRIQSMTTTAFTIDGCRVVQSLGVVRGGLKRRPRRHGGRQNISVGRRRYKKDKGRRFLPFSGKARTVFSDL